MGAQVALPHQTSSLTMPETRQATSTGPCGAVRGPGAAGRAPRTTLTLPTRCVSGCPRAAFCAAGLARDEGLPCIRCVGPSHRPALPLARQPPPGPHHAQLEFRWEQLVSAMEDAVQPGKPSRKQPAIGLRGGDWDPQIAFLQEGLGLGQAAVQRIARVRPSIFNYKPATLERKARYFLDTLGMRCVFVRVLACLFVRCCG